MKLLRRDDYPGGKFTNGLCRLWSGGEQHRGRADPNWGREEPYEIGTGFGHLALGVNDIYAVCAELEEAGAKIPRKPGPMQHGTTHIAFIEDPDGYRIELIGLDTMR